ncbi:MAG: ABC transporter ATP-binding protein [Chlamydiota bacterium]
MHPNPLLEVLSVIKTFSHHKKKKAAINNISLRVYPGETLAIAGESGSGKSTMAKMMVGLERPSSGEILFKGKPLSSYDRKERSTHIQMIFQDAYSALNPKMHIKRILQEPFHIHKREVSSKDIIDLLHLVSLSEDILEKYPHECSGGQRQRIVIARALALQPKLIVCDEPISSLDVSIQAQILNLFSSLQKQHNFTYVFIGHDLSVLRHISTRIAIFYLGELVELAKTEDFYTSPLHPYSELLLSSIPTLDPERERKKHASISSHCKTEEETCACPFFPRCRYQQERCLKEKPSLQEKKEGHFVSCHIR